MTPAQKIRHLQQAAQHLRCIAQTVGPQHAYWDEIFAFEESARAIERAGHAAPKCDHLLAISGIEGEQKIRPSTLPSDLAIELRSLQRWLKSHDDRVSEGSRPSPTTRAQTVALIADGGRAHFIRSTEWFAYCPECGGFLPTPELMLEAHAPRVLVEGREPEGY